MRLPSPGQTFQRKYKLQEILGRGGFAVVYRATDIEVGRDVAIKVLAPGDDGYSPGLVSRFGREARVIAGLQDPHTITMFDFGRSEEGLLFMVFEYVRGIDLSEVIRRRGPLDSATTVHILEQILHSLREAHRAGILHRDIKPPNILVYQYMEDEYRVKLLDFGIAKPVLKADEGGINITREGAIVGTPRYMAPEQIYGGELSASSDLYSLGLVAHEMLTGEPAIRGGTSKETIRAQLSETPVTLPRDVGASEELCRIVDIMTAREPADRYDSASAVLRALEFVEEDATEKMVMPAVGGFANFDRPAAAPAPEGPDPVPATEPHPTRLTEPKQGVSNAAIIAGGLLFGAGLVAALLVAGSYDEQHETPAAIEDPVVDPFARLPTPHPQVKHPVPRAEDPPPLAATAHLDEGDAGKADAAREEKPEVVTGCGMEAGWSGEKSLFVDIGLSRRYWTAYVPKSYQKDRPHRVVMMFHKVTKSGSEFLHASQFHELADRENLVVLAPDAADIAAPWLDHSDVAFVERMLEETGRVLCLETTQVYAIGHGGGAEFARDLACRVGLSGIAVTGHGLRADQRYCDPKPPVPTILLAGKTNRYIPFEGGPSCLGTVFASIEEAEQDLREKNACSGKRRTYSSRSGGTCYTWDCEQPFVSCHLEGGHDWRGAPREAIEFPGCVTKPANFPHRDTIWKFLEREGKKLDD